MREAIREIVDGGMNEVGFPVIHDDSDFPISGRELHDALGISTRYNDWFPRMCDYGFFDGKDYYSKMSNRSDGLPGKQRQDHFMKINMAKEICMLQRTPQGKTIRQYLISIEEAWNTPEQVMARALKMADQVQKNLRDQIMCLEADNQRLAEANEELTPLADYAGKVLASDNTFTITEIAKDYGWTARRMNDFLHQKRVQYWDGRMWILYAEHDDEGYTKTETVYYQTRDGYKSSMNTKWTQKGRHFIHGLMEKSGYYLTGANGDVQLRLYDSANG